MENMAALIQQLSGNPLQTPIGIKIEQATDPSLPSEDWNLNMLICDMINDTDEGPRDAVRAIKKRLQTAGKNHTIIMYTLTVLETMVKNCGRRLHILVTNKDFVNELVKLIGPKNEPPLLLQQKVLSIIQTWADAFRGQPDLRGVVEVYNDMKSKSIEFPVSNYEFQVPIHTPQRSVPINKPSNHISLYQHALGINPNQLPTNPVQVSQGNNFAIANRMAGPIVLNEEQLAKLKSEIEIVKGNIKVFDEMLTELDKSKGLQQEDLDLLHELNATCLQMQKRIVELLDRVSNEEVTSELLTVNDNLNNLFSRYEVYSVKGQVNTTNQPLPQLANSQYPAAANISGQPLAIAQPPPTTRPRTKPNQEEASLIDLRESNNLSNQLEGLQLAAEGGTQQPNRLSKQSGDTDFDEFAQLRSAEKQPRMVDGVEMPNDQEAREMEAWIREQNSEAPASLSENDFDRFLSSRLNNIENNQTPAKKSTNKPSGDLLDL